MTKKELIESWEFQHMPDDTELVAYVDGRADKFYIVENVSRENGFFDENLQRQYNLNLPYMELMAFKLKSDVNESVYKEERYKKIEDELHELGYQSPQELLHKIEEMEHDAHRLPPGVMSGSLY